MYCNATEFSHLWINNIYPQVCTFKSDGKVQKAEVQCFTWQLNEFFANRKNQLELQWDTCLIACSNFS